MRALALALLLTGAAPGPSAEPIQPPLTVYAAGSTTGALGAMLQRYTAETGQTVTLRTGPAGLMREKIEQGDPVDLFVSANMAHPQHLTASHRAGPTVVFARNTLCVSALHEVGLTRANLLDRLLDPKVRIGTSTPKADPGGDYAMELFDKAGSVRPGATALLKAKARPVVGGSIEPPRAADAPKTSARDGMLQRHIDVSIGYCSARETTPDTSVDKVALPPALAIRARYGMAILTTSHDAKREAAAGQLAMYLLSPAAQALLVPYGFLPAADTAP
jgi:ABC-type molybdate transport system substrate-binding protein